MLNISNQEQRKCPIHLDHEMYAAILQLMNFILESMVPELS
jgi:hypothetical protein